MWRNGRRNGLKIRSRESGVWVRIPSSAPSENPFYEGKSIKTAAWIDCAASRNKTHEITAYLPSIRQVRLYHEARFAPKARSLIASADCKRLLRAKKAVRSSSPGIVL